MTTVTRENTGDLLAPTPLRFIRQPEVLDRIGVAWITIVRWEEAGLFPKRRKLGERVVGWVESEIDEWCAGKAAQGSELGQ